MLIESPERMTLNMGLHHSKSCNISECLLNSYYSNNDSIFTKDVSRAIRFAKGLEAGKVVVNSSWTSDSNLAFGGWKGSGIGRELGEHCTC